MGKSRLHFPNNMQMGSNIVFILKLVPERSVLWWEILVCVSGEKFKCQIIKKERF